MSDDLGNDVAIVGMALRVLGARTVEDYWRNLKNGVESVTFFSEEELIAEGVTPETLRHEHYVRGSPVLERMEHFDAEFFGFSPKEAAIMDPQHRQFLECAWEALESAGHPPENFDGSIGVFGGCGMGGYFAFNITGCSTSIAPAPVTPSCLGPATSS